MVLKRAQLAAVLPRGGALEITLTPGARRTVTLSHGVTNRRGQYACPPWAEDQKIASADGLLLPDRVLAEKLAVHHGNAPVSPAVDAFRRFVAVAEIPEHASKRQRLAAFEAAVARGSRTGQHTLPHAISYGLGEAIAVHPE